MIKNPGKAGAIDISYTCRKFRQWYDEEIKKPKVRI